MNENVLFDHDNPYNPIYAHLDLFPHDESVSLLQTIPQAQIIAQG